MPGLKTVTFKNKTEQKSPHPCIETVNFAPKFLHWLTIPRYVTWAADLQLGISQLLKLMLQFKIVFLTFFFLFGIFIFWCKTDVLEINYCLHFSQHRNNHLMRTKANPCWVPSSVNISHQTTVGISCFISSDMVICQRPAFFSPTWWSL